MKWFTVCAAVSCAASARAAENDVPLPELANAEPQVRRKIDRAREHVVSSPDSAEAWGRYGMVLDAHDCRTAAEVAYRRAHALAPSAFRWAYFLGVLLEKTDPSAAVAFLHKATRLDAEYAPAHVRLGAALESLGRVDEAWREYNRAVAIDPANLTALTRRGQMALQRGDAEQAVRDLKKVVAKRPHSARALTSLARAYFRTGHKPLARETAAAARGLAADETFDDPRHAQVMAEAVNLRAYRQRATRLRDAGRLQEAMAAVRAGLSHAPDDEAMLAAQADIAFQLRDYRTAARAARRALNGGVKVENVRAMLAVSLFKIGDLDAAAKQAEMALRDQPDNVTMHRLCADLFAQRGEPLRARKHLMCVLEIEPADATARLMLGRLWVEAAQPAEAVAHLRRFTAEHPDHLEARSLLATALLQAERFREAEEAFAAALRLAPGHARLVQGMAHALKGQERYEDARSRLEAALKLAPKDAAIMNDLAWLLATCPDEAVRDGARAVQLAEELVSSSTRRLGPLDTLATAYAEAGAFDRAVATMREVVAQAKRSGVAPQRFATFTERLRLFENGKAYRSP